MSSFKLEAPFKPTGDQPQAIEKLVDGLKVGIHENEIHENLYPESIDSSGTETWEIALVTEMPSMSAYAKS